MLPALLKIGRLLMRHEQPIDVSTRNLSFGGTFGEQRCASRTKTSLTDLTEDDMMKKLLAFLLAGALVAPQIAAASESVFNKDGERQAVSKFPEKLQLPPVRFLETMPWIDFETQSKWRGIDTLLLPDLSVTAASKNSAYVGNSLSNVEMLPKGTASE
jgi:hypothetical protein